MSPRALPLFALCVAPAFLALPGCGGGPACVIDTDCPLGSRCALDQTCQPIGTMSDAGSRPDAGARDAAVADSGPADSGPVDASSDAGPACPAPAAGTYSVAEPFVGCVFTSGAQVTITAGDVECGWVAASVADPVADGTFTVATDGTISASVRVAGATDAVTCTGTFTEADGRIAFTCPPDCVITLAPI